MPKTSHKIKVLSVVNSISNGGAGRAAYRIHQGVNSISQDVQSMMFVKTVTPQPDIATLSQFIPKGVWFVVFDWVATKIKNKIQHAVWRPYKKRQDKSYKSDLRGTWLNRALKKQDYDVLHLHWINNRFIKIEDLPTDKPIVWTLHDSWPFCGTCHYFLDCEGYKKECGCCPQLGSTNSNDLSHQVWRKKKKAFERLDLHIVTPSKWLAACAAQSSLFKKLDIRVIPNCIDIDKFSAKPKEKAFVRWLLTQEKRLGKTFILYGAVNAATDKIKGFLNLLSALQIMEDKYDCSNMELFVFGADKPIDALKVKMPVHYLGYINNDEDMALLYSLADVMVVPSITENLSCTIMESLSCETPVCCFNIGGNSDMVEHKKNGYLARELDGMDLACGIVWCIENNMGGQLGKNGRQKVLDNYTIENVSRQYTELYRDIL